ncbi:MULTISPECIES: acyl-CoA dehydrogenase family protein [Saccharolobus]|uniref:Acyl-CoA dehydrogenase n=4 Tax=Saccharolobus TaxID=2100760 RepID=A0A8F5GYH0_9CREN|nr:MULTISPECIES: acyl-CoA dehydrogenase family protein [Sulfolobaceae]PVU76837.1 acyl-CoA dehydrogenase [Sulfolobus islandicus]ACP56358.1 acyl-CoA dehydrogenase domain protein [Sulfolobus islandicus M.16.27]ACR43034.1 acyl-CoA dehydrogenase domain protein [Sulfolobus islandicus M.16.4]QXJ27733.1 Acyl-CoA dehydrogenase [Saccharolobus shibatae B12]QXJ31057.1 Acyl-CoA dehydrogenase [Saccharolobus shibatae]
MVLPFNSVEAFSVNVSEKHELFRRAVREFMERDVAPYVEKGEKEGTVPKEVLEKAKEIGLYGVAVPEQYGGQGGDTLMTAIAQEEISRVWASLSTRISVGGLFMTPILLFGNEEQKKKYVTPVARGDKVAAFANTEPAAGSDVAGIQTVAKKINGKYVINGRKIFITNGGIADYYVVTARTSPPEPNARWKGISMFIVEREWKGVKVLNRIETMGLRASNTAELAFEDVEVPAENLLGEEGNGFKYAMATFDRTRVGVAAQGVGVAQAALERMVTYSTQRFAFQSPLIGFQMVQEKIAESLTEVNTARLLTYWAASLFDRGLENEAIVAASMAKLYATDIAEKVAIRAITVHGGYGVATSTGVERLLRDVEVMRIYEGANDIQKLVILRETARRLLGIKM